MPAQMHHSFTAKSAKSLAETSADPRRSYGEAMMRTVTGLLTGCTFDSSTRISLIYVTDTLYQGRKTVADQCHPSRASQAPMCTL